jgi:hypothetical protein
MHHKIRIQPPEYLHALFSGNYLLLMVDTHRYYHQYLDSLDDGWTPLPDVTLKEMYSFLALILQMGHDMSDTLKAYWTTIEQFSSPFFGKKK